MTYVNNDPEYAHFLEDDLDGIDSILARLLWARENNDIETIDTLFAQIEEWMGDDWWISLPESEQQEFIAKNCSE